MVHCCSCSHYYLLSLVIIEVVVAVVHGCELVVSVASDDAIMVESKRLDADVAHVRNFLF
jgi:hypothetical protein